MKNFHQKQWEDYSGPYGKESLRIVDRPLANEDTEMIARAISKNERKALRKLGHKRQLWQEFKGVCPYCLCSMRLHAHGQDKVRGNVATIDHVIPKCKQGLNTIDNLLVVCATCNRKKGDMSLIKFMQSRSIRIRVAYNSRM